MVIPDYICSLPEMKSLTVSSVDGLTLTYRFVLRGQENQALYFRREIYKRRAATEVIFLCFSAKWLAAVAETDKFCGNREGWTLCMYKLLLLCVLCSVCAGATGHVWALLCESSRPRAEMAIQFFLL